MATRTSTTLFPTNNTDADFRGWVQFIEDTLVTTGGWAVTGDTGQMTISTATKPGAANTKVGYRIYQMQDSLQGSAPIYLKLYFGSGTATLVPGVWITVGTGSDGSGNITGVMYFGEGNATADCRSGSSSTTQANTCYGSAATGRVTVSLFTQGASGAYYLTFGIERTVDASGAVTGEGVILAYTAAGSPMSRSHYLVAGANTQPPVETGLAHVISSANPSSFGGDVGIGVLIPIRGVAKQPAYGWAMVKSSDFTVETTFTMTLYSTSITYLHLNLLEVQVPGGSSVASTRLAMRYD